MEFVAASMRQGKRRIRAPTLASSEDRSVNLLATRWTTSPSRWILPLMFSMFMLKNGAVVEHCHSGIHMWRQLWDSGYSYRDTSDDAVSSIIV